jgi:hypothetical protein
MYPDMNMNQFITHIRHQVMYLRGVKQQLQEDRFFDNEKYHRLLEYLQNQKTREEDPFLNMPRDLLDFYKQEFPYLPAEKPVNPDLTPENWNYHMLPHEAKIKGRVTGNDVKYHLNLIQPSTAKQLIQDYKKMSKTQLEDLRNATIHARKGQEEPGMFVPIEELYAFALATRFVAEKVLALPQENSTIAANKSLIPGGYEKEVDELYHKILADPNFGVVDALWYYITSPEFELRPHRIKNLAWKAFQSTKEGAQFLADHLLGGTAPKDWEQYKIDHPDPKDQAEYLTKWWESTPHDLANAILYNLPGAEHVLESLGRTATHAFWKTGSTLYAVDLSTQRRSAYGEVLDNMPYNIKTYGFDPAYEPTTFRTARVLGYKKQENIPSQLPNIYPTSAPSAMSGQTVYPSSHQKYVSSMDHYDPIKFYEDLRKQRLLTLQEKVKQEEEERKIQEEWAKNQTANLNTAYGLVGQAFWNTLYGVGGATAWTGNTLWNVATGTWGFGTSIYNSYGNGQQTTFQPAGVPPPPGSQPAIIPPPPTKKPRPKPSPAPSPGPTPKPSPSPFLASGKPPAAKPHPAPTPGPTTPSGGPTLIPSLGASHPPGYMPSGQPLVEWLAELVFGPAPGRTRAPSVPPLHQLKLQPRYSNKILSKDHALSNAYVPSPAIIPSLQTIRFKNIGHVTGSDHVQWKPKEKMHATEEEALQSARQDQEQIYAQVITEISQKLRKTNAFISQFVTKQVFEKFGKKQERIQLAQQIKDYIKRNPNLMDLLDRNPRFKMLLKLLEEISGDWEDNGEQLVMLMAAILEFFESENMLPNLKVIMMNAAHVDHGGSLSDPELFQHARTKETTSHVSPVNYLKSILSHWDFWRGEELDKSKFEKALVNMTHLETSRENNLISDEQYMKAVREFYEKDLEQLFMSAEDNHSMDTKKRIQELLQKFNHTFMFASSTLTGGNIRHFKLLVNRIRNDINYAHKDSTAAKTVTNTVNDVVDKVKGGAIDLEQAYRSLTGLGHIHQTVIHPAPRAKITNLTPLSKTDANMFNFKGIHLNLESLGKDGYQLQQLGDESYGTSVKFRKELMKQIKSLRGDPVIAKFMNMSLEELKALSKSDKVEIKQKMQEHMKSKPILKHLSFTNLFNHFQYDSDPNKKEEENFSSLTQDLITLRNVIASLEDWAKRKSTPEAVVNAKLSTPSKFSTWNQKHANMPVDEKKEVIPTHQLAQYSDHPTKEYVETGQFDYKDAKEYNIKNDNDLARMLHEIKNVKGTLYIIDMKTGRMYPIQPELAFRNAIYIWKPAHKQTKTSGGTFALSAVRDSIHREDQDLMPYHHLRGGNDKIFGMYHKLATKKHSCDYRDQVKSETGAGLWSYVKKKVNHAADSLVTGVKDAGHTLSKSSMQEYKNLKQREQTNLRHLTQSGSNFVKHPSWKSFSDTARYAGQTVSQPVISGLRETANVSSAADKIPGMSLIKTGAEFAIPALGVVDHLAQAVSATGVGSNQKADYLKAVTNLGDAVIGNVEMPGIVQNGARVLNTTGKVADYLHDRPK